MSLTEALKRFFDDSRWGKALGVDSEFVYERTAGPAATEQGVGYRVGPNLLLFPDLQLHLLLLGLNGVEREIYPATDSREAVVSARNRFGGELRGTYSKYPDLQGLERLFVGVGLALRAHAISTPSDRLLSADDSRRLCEARQAAGLSCEEENQGTRGLEGPNGVHEYSGYGLGVAARLELGVDLLDVGSAHVLQVVTGGELEAERMSLGAAGGPDLTHWSFPNFLATVGLRLAGQEPIIDLKQKERCDSDLAEETEKLFRRFVGRIEYKATDDLEEKSKPAQSIEEVLTRMRIEIQMAEQEGRKVTIEKLHGYAKQARQFYREALRSYQELLVKREELITKGSKCADESTKYPMKLIAQLRHRLEKRYLEAVGPFVEAKAEALIEALQQMPTEDDMEQVVQILQSKGTLKPEQTLESFTGIQEKQIRGVVAANLLETKLTQETGRKEEGLVALPTHDYSLRLTINIPQEEKQRWTLWPLIGLIRKQLEGLVHGKTLEVFVAEGPEGTKDTKVVKATTDAVEMAAELRRRESTVAPLLFNDIKEDQAVRGTEPSLREDPSQKAVSWAVITLGLDLDQLMDRTP